MPDLGRSPAVVVRRTPAVGGRRRLDLAPTFSWVRMSSTPGTARAFSERMPRMRPAADGAGHQPGEGGIGDRLVGGVARGAGDLGRAVDPRDGVARQSRSAARAMSDSPSLAASHQRAHQRLAAELELERLCRPARAPWRKRPPLRPGRRASVSAWPRRAASASRRPPRLVATPPSAMRASRTMSAIADRARPRPRRARIRRTAGRESSDTASARVHGAAGLESRRSSRPAQSGLDVAAGRRRRRCRSSKAISAARPAASLDRGVERDQRLRRSRRDRSRCRRRWSQHRMVAVDAARAPRSPSRDCACCRPPRLRRGSRGSACVAAHCRPASPCCAIAGWRRAARLCGDDGIVARDVGMARRVRHARSAPSRRPSRPALDRRIAGRRPLMSTTTLGPHHVELHQIEERGPAGQELARPRSAGADVRGERRRPRLDRQARSIGRTGASGPPSAAWRAGSPRRCWDRRRSGRGCRSCIRGSRRRCRVALVDAGDRRHDLARACNSRIGRRRGR